MQANKPIINEVNELLADFTKQNMVSDYAGCVTTMASESFEPTQIKSRVLDAEQDISGIVNVASGILQKHEGVNLNQESLKAALEGVKTTMLINAANRAGGKPAMEAMGASLYNAHGAGINYGVPVNFSSEGFDLINDEKSVIYSAIYNYQATKQAEWAALYYPLLVLKAEETHFNWEISIDYIHDEYKYPTNGDIAQRNLVPFVELIYDKSRIHANHTQLHPVWSNQPGSNTSAHFVSDTLIAPTPHPLDPTMLTSYLAGGARFSIINLGTSGLKNIGTVNNTDQLDQNLLIESIAVKLSRAGATDEAVVLIPIEATPRSLFMKNEQGTEDAIVVNYRNEEVILHADTVLADGVTKLGATDCCGAFLTNGQFFRIGFTAAGDAFIDTGTVQLDLTAGKKYGLYDENKVPVTLLPTEYQDLVVEPIGFKLNARLSNSNMRTIGQQAMSKTYSRKIGIGLQSGFSSFLNEQLAGQNRRAEQLAKLVEATKIVIEKEQIRKLKEWAQKLAFWQKYMTMDLNNEFKGQFFEGLAHYLLDPYYRKDTMDVTTLVQNNQSIDKVADIQSAMHQYLADAIMDAGIKSRFIGVRDYMMGGASNAGFSVSIITDPYIHNFLMREGDPRLFGETIGDAKIAYSSDKTFTNKIYIALTDKGAQPGDVLGRGFTLWKPEVVYDRPVSRLNGHYELLISQPRFAIVNNIPVLIELDVKNLAAVVRDAVPFKIQTAIGTP